MTEHTVTLSLIDDLDGRWKRLALELLVDWWNEQKTLAKLDILDISVSTETGRSKTGAEGHLGSVRKHLPDFTLPQGGLSEARGGLSIDSALALPGPKRADPLGGRMKFNMPKLFSNGALVPDGIELWVANDIAESLAMIQRTRNARSSSLIWIAGDFSMEESLVFTRFGVNGWIADGDDLLRWRPALKRRFSRLPMLVQ